MMRRFGWKEKRDRTGEDALAAHRAPITYATSIVGVIFVLPFVINDLLQGRLLLGLGGLFVVLILGVNAVAIRLKKAPLIPFSLLLPPMAVGVAVSLRTQGVIGALWCFPTVLFFYFVLSRRVASLCSFILLVVATIMGYLYAGAELTIRFSITFTLTVININIILNVISDLQRRLLDQAITDPLTGAFNRRHMDSCLSAAIERNQRAAAPASLLIIDVDHFKRVNDHFGHAAGDRVLKEIVTLISQRARKLDLLFRMGGEEFLLLLPDTRAGDATILAEHLRARLAEARMIEDWQVCVSIGVSELQPDDTIDSWITRTDDALYLAKRAGRNRVVCREPSRPTDLSTSPKLNLPSA